MKFNFLGTAVLALLISAPAQLVAADRGGAGQQQVTSCPVCSDNAVALQDFAALKCGHGGCKACLNVQVDGALRDKNLRTLNCVTCQKPYTRPDIRTITNDQNKVKAFGDLSYERDLKKAGANKHCPTPNCGTWFFYTEGVQPKSHTCYTCNKSYCPKCLEGHADSMTCEQAKASRDSDAKRGAADKANADWIKKNTKPCPQCKTPIEKNEGCSHMMCKACNTHFCWACLEKYDIRPGARDYNHACSKLGQQWVAIYDPNPEAPRTRQQIRQTWERLYDRYEPLPVGDHDGDLTSEEAVRNELDKLALDYVEQGRKKGSINVKGFYDELRSLSFRAYRDGYLNGYLINLVDEDLLNVVDMAVRNVNQAVYDRYIRRFPISEPLQQFYAAVFKQLKPAAAQGVGGGVAAGGQPVPAQPVPQPARPMPVQPPAAMPVQPARPVQPQPQPHVPAAKVVAKLHSTNVGFVGGFGSVYTVRFESVVSSAVANKFITHLEGVARQANKVVTGTRPQAAALTIQDIRFNSAISVDEFNKLLTEANATFRG